MTKKILTVLAPVAALIAFMVVPTLAQATTAQKEGKALEVGKTVQAQSSDLTFDTGSAKLQCKESTVHGKLTSNGGASVVGSVEKGTFTAVGGGACATDNLLNSTAHISLAGLPWTLTVQQPDAVTKKVVAHLTGDIIFTAQAQAFGGSVATCTYQATSIQFNGVEKGGVEDHFMTVDSSAGAQFTRTAGGFPCEAKGTLQGKIQLESEGKPLTIDMT